MRRRAFRSGVAASNRGSRTDGAGRKNLTAPELEAGSGVSLLRRCSAVSDREIAATLQSSVHPLRHALARARQRRTQARGHGPVEAALGVAGEQLFAIGREPAGPIIQCNPVAIAAAVPLNPLQPFGVA